MADNTPNTIDVLFVPANPLEKSDPHLPPFAPGHRLVPAGTVVVEGGKVVPIDIQIDQDLAVPMRDGVTLYADLYRPAAATQPLPTILIYTPYAKQGGYWNTDVSAVSFGIPQELFSGLGVFEAVDPAFWCEHGYAILVVDARGTGHSGGDMAFMGTQLGRDIYDAVEWVAEQDWSNEHVGMAGNSQLAMAQWAAAALRPPHLSAIAPWEGLTDVFRDVVGRGGMLDDHFHDVDIIGNLYGLGSFEDVTGMHRAHPTDNAYWADKRADLSQIEIPAYVVASWSNPIHTRNTHKAFEVLASERKWLRVHNTQEWDDIAQPENVDDLRRFFDRYLKGEDNGWETTPRVRYAVLDIGGTDILGRTSQTWPAEGIEPTVLHLDAATMSMTDAAPEGEAACSYDSTTGDSVRFAYPITAETELLGPLNARLWVEAAEGDDLDLFAVVYKLNADGEQQYHVMFPGMREMAAALREMGGLNNAMAYVGPHGRLRASHRALDEERSTMLAPYLSHLQEERVEPGTPVYVEIGLWPTGMVLHPGETLVLEVSGSQHVGGLLQGTISDGPVVRESRNVGIHSIRTGGAFDSTLVLPISRASEVNAAPNSGR